MIFNYDPGVANAEFKKCGYAHLRGVLNSSFLDSLIEFYHRANVDGENEIREKKIYGKKRQFLFRFSSAEDEREFRQGISRLTGIDEEALTISERHVYIYDSNAEPWPAPHKDRAASEVSIGFPIHCPDGSSACVFPGLELGPNAEERAIYLTKGVGSNGDLIYETEDSILLNEEPGDVVLFLGSSLYHSRVKAAGTAVLYIKVNSEMRDPLGENESCLLESNA